MWFCKLELRSLRSHCMTNLDVVDAYGIAWIIQITWETAGDCLGHHPWQDFFAQKTKMPSLMLLYDLCHFVGHIKFDFVLKTTLQVLMNTPLFCRENWLWQKSLRSFQLNLTCRWREGEAPVWIGSASLFSLRHVSSSKCLMPH